MRVITLLLSLFVAVPCFAGQGMGPGPGVVAYAPVGPQILNSALVYTTGINVDFNVVSGATSYNLYYKSGSAPTTSSYTGKITGITNDISASATLTSGTTYYVGITSVTSGVESAISNIVSSSASAGYTLTLIVDSGSSLSVYPFNTYTAALSPGTYTYNNVSQIKNVQSWSQGGGADAGGGGGVFYLDNYANVYMAGGGGGGGDDSNGDGGSEGDGYTTHNASASASGGSSGSGSAGENGTSIISGFIGAAPYTPNNGGITAGGGYNGGSGVGYVGGYYNLTSNTTIHLYTGSESTAGGFSTIQMYVR
jgi:hypothetical protein